MSVSRAELKPKMTLNPIRFIDMFPIPTQAIIAGSPRWPTTTKLIISINIVITFYKLIGKANDNTFFEREIKFEVSDTS